MKLRYFLFHILMCLALAFVVPSCVDPVEDPEEIVDEEEDEYEDEEGEYDGDVLYEEALDNICEFVNDLYLESSTLKELADHSKSIKKIKGVAKVYTSDIALFVETVHGAKLSWTYFPVPEVRSSDDYQVTLITEEGLETKSEVSLYEIVPEYEDVCIFFQMCDDERYEDLLSEYEELADRLEDCGAYVDMVYDFDIEFLQESITEYDVVILVTSGFYEKDINGEYKHWIMLSEAGEDYVYEMEDDVSSDVICGYVKEYWSGEADYWGYLMVSEDFLEENIKGSFDETSLIFNTAGESLKTDPGLSDMFESKGAGAYVGYENAGMDIASEKAFFDGLMQGGSVSETLAVVDLLTSSISKGDDVRIVDKDSDDDMDDGDDDGNGNEDEEQILDPEEAAKYVSESAYKVAEYIKKNYSDSYSEEDFEAIIDWLWNQDYVEKVEYDEYYSDIHSTFKDGTDFHVVTMYDTETAELNTRTTFETKSESYNYIVDVASSKNEFIQESNKFLYVWGIPKGFDGWGFKVLDCFGNEIDILKKGRDESPVQLVIVEKEGLDALEEPLHEYGAILISATHGILGNKFVVCDKLESYSVLVRIGGFYLEGSQRSLKDIYDRLKGNNPAVYANYCWSAYDALEFVTEGSFIGYNALTNVPDNLELVESYFASLFNGLTHNYIAERLEPYEWRWFIDNEGHFNPTLPKIKVTPQSYGEPNLRYFSIRTDEPEITNDNRVIVKGQFKGYKNLKPEVTYKIYYKEGHLGFSSPNESGVESITLNKDDIGSDGTLRIDITDKLKIYKYYSICLGFEYNGNCYLGNICDDFRTPLTVTPGQWVDLGLSVEWAGWNVDASSPEEYGGYYAWGETKEKSEYKWNNYENRECADYDHNHRGDDCYCWKWKFIGNEISGTSYDVASVKLGGGARMPNLAEIKDLVNNCTFRRGTYNGVNGNYVIGPNGNVIFLPFAGFRCDDFYDDEGGLYDEGHHGYYWSGTCEVTYSDDTIYGYSIFELISDGWYHDCYWDRDARCDVGRSVRPVRNK